VKNHNLLLILSLVLLIFARFLFLDADRMGGGQFVDLGFHSHGPKSAVLYGTWEPDEFKTSYAITLFAFFIFLSFKIFGVGLASINLVSAFFGSLTLLVVYLLVRRLWNAKGALLTLILFGSDRLMTEFHRIGFTETTMNFFIVLSGLLVLYPKRKFLTFMSGIFFVLAIFTKSYAIFFLPFILILLSYPSWEDWSRRKVLKRFSLFSLGFITCLSFWLWLYVFPHADSIFAINRMWNDTNLPLSLSQYFLYLGRWLFSENILFIGNSSFLAPLFLFSLFFLAIRFLNLGGSFLSRLKKFKIESLCLAWILTSTPFFILTSWQWARRYSIYLIPMALLTARFFLTCKKEDDFRAWLKKLLGNSPAYLRMGFILLPLFCLLPLLTKAMRFWGLSDPALAGYGVTLIGLLGVFAFDLFFRKWPTENQTRFLTTLIISTTLISLLIPYLSRAIKFFFYEILAATDSRFFLAQANLVALVLATLCLLFFTKPIYQKIQPYSKEFHLFLILFCLLSNVLFVGKHLIHPTFHYRDASRLLSHTVKKGDVVLGRNDIFLFCLETKAMPLFPIGWDAENSSGLYSNTERMKEINWNALQDQRPNYLFVHGLPEDLSSDSFFQHLEGVDLEEVAKIPFKNNSSQLYRILTDEVN